jgi:hypothetical protein
MRWSGSVLPQLGQQRNQTIPVIDMRLPADWIVDPELFDRMAGLSVIAAPASRDEIDL